MSEEKTRIKSVGTSGNFPRPRKKKNGVALGTLSLSKSRSFKGTASFGSSILDSIANSDDSGGQKFIKSGGSAFSLASSRTPRSRFGDDLVDVFYVLFELDYPYFDFDLWEVENNGVACFQRELFSEWMEKCFDVTDNFDVIGQKLLDYKLIIPLNECSEFSEGTYFKRNTTICSNNVSNLNSLVSWSSSVRDAFDVVKECLNRLFKIYDFFELKSISDMNYDDIASSTIYQDFLLSVCEIQQISLDNRNDKYKLAFFLNLYQLILLHGFIASPPGEIVDHRSWVKYLDTLSYNVGTDKITCTDIEFRILFSENNFPKSNSNLKYIKNRSLKKTMYNITRVPMEILFGLNFGLYGQKFRIFDKDMIIKQLKKSTRYSFRNHIKVELIQNLRKSTVNIKKTIILPPVVEFYENDMGMKKKEPIDEMNLIFKYYFEEKSFDPELGEDVYYTFQPWEWNQFKFNFRRDPVKAEKSYRKIMKHSENRINSEIRMKQITDGLNLLDPEFIDYVFQQCYNFIERNPNPLLFITKGKKSEVLSLRYLLATYSGIPKQCSVHSVIDFLLRFFKKTSDTIFTFHIEQSLKNLFTNLHKRYKLSFDFILENERAKAYFRWFLKMHYCLENYLCYEDIKYYQMMKTAEERELFSKEIMSKYLDDNAPEMVNVTSSDRNAIGKDFETNKFDEVQRSVKRNMAIDSYVSFQRSEECKNYYKENIPDTIKDEIIEEIIIILSQMDPKRRQILKDFLNVCTAQTDEFPLTLQHTGKRVSKKLFASSNETSLENKKKISLITVFILENFHQIFENL